MIHLNRIAPLLAVSLMALSPCLLGADEADNADNLAGSQRAKLFWKTLAGGKTDELKEFYAAEVVLKAGSELLKPEWKVSEQADRSKDLKVNRDALLAGYGRMIERVTQEKWVRIFQAIGEDKVRVSTSQQDNQPIAGAKQGDTVLQVQTGPGDDQLLFVLRADTQGVLRVTLEFTDY